MTLLSPIPLPPTPTPDKTCFTMPFFGHSSKGEKSSPPLLPLSNGHSPGSSRTYRFPSRKISYTIKQRANRHSNALALVLFAACLFLVYTYTHPAMSPFSFSSATNAGKLHLYTREQYTGVDSNGLSLLSELESELSREDDLFWKQVDEPGVKSHDQKEAERKQKLLKAQNVDKSNFETVHALASLVWWIAEGGVFPSDFDVPSTEDLYEMGGKGFEALLDRTDKVDSGETIFQDGWEDYAKSQYRTVVFSKSYCPFSRRAKDVLENYLLTPAPFVIELDRRSDMSVLQTILQRYTGRRTVPNVLFDFESAGGADEIVLLHSEGGLLKRFEEMGILPANVHRRPMPIGKHIADEMLQLEGMGEYEMEGPSTDEDDEGGGY